MASYLRFLLGVFLLTNILAVVLISTAFVWYKLTEATPGPPPATSATPNEAASPLVTTPSPVPTETAAAQAPPPAAETPSPVASPPAPPAELSNLTIPVAGVRADQLRDTFNDARGGDRVHNAIDIMAPRWTPVLAADDGDIVRFFYSDRGGNTIYQMSPDKKFVFYYAHLERYADKLATGQRVRRGDVIGYVGDTGNAGTGNYHLHFSIWIVTDPKRYWDGVNINPYSVLRNAQ